MCQATWTRSLKVEGDLFDTHLYPSVIMVQVVNSFYAKFAGRTVEEMEMETNRENYLSPERAVELGVIDGIVWNTESPLFVL